jgi:hypothetical protein
MHIEFEDAAAFLEEYERSLASGWIFVPSREDFELGEALEITLDLVFCGRSVRVLGVVTSRISRVLADLLERPAGAVVEFADGIEALDEMIRDTIASLGRSLWQRRDAFGDVRAARSGPGGESGPASSAAHVESHARDLGRPGAVLEVAGLDLKIGERVSLQMTDPRTGELVALSGHVVRAPAAAAPAAASGESAPVHAQLAEPRATSVASARRAGISGNLAGLSLPSLLQSIATSSHRGTLDINAPGLDAHLLFESNRLRYARAGKIEGVKALARLLECPDGEFSFEPTIREDEPDRPLTSIDGALMEAAHQLDELRRLQGALPPATVLLEKTEAGLAIQLSETEAALLNHLNEPRSPSALLDSLPDPDAEIWKALIGLLDSGFVRFRELPASC